MLLWTLVPAFVHRAPPLDVVELYITGREWVLLTYKHPQLPAWCLEVARQLTGALGWPAYLVSQLFVAATFVLVYLLGCDLLGRRRAAAGTLLLTGVYYFSFPTPEFNHNVAQMPIWAAIAFFLWRAVDRGKVGWWLALAIVAAAGLYTKFSVAMLFAAAGAWVLVDAHARNCLARRAPWVAFVVFALLVTPLVQALVGMDYLPLEYASIRSASQSPNAPRFLLAQLADHAGLFAMLAVAFLWRRPAAADDDDRIDPAPGALRFLLIMTFGPLALATLVAAISGAKDMWGAPMFSLSGLIAMALVPRLTHASLKRIAVFAALFVVGVPAVYAVVVAMKDSRNEPTRVAWPQAEIAARFTRIWREETGAPLKIVAGEPWTAGLVGTLSPDEPSIYISLNRAYSPWITDERLRREGMLVLWWDKWPIDLGALRERLPELTGGSESFVWSSRPGAPPVTVNYAVVPPADDSDG